MSIEYENRDKDYFGTEIFLAQTLPIKSLIRQLGVTLPFRLSRSFSLEFCLNAINCLIEWHSIFPMLEAQRPLSDPDQGCISAQALEVEQSPVLMGAMEASLDPMGLSA